MLCKQCNFESVSTEQFCSNCGATLAVNQQVPGQDISPSFAPGFILDKRYSFDKPCSDVMRNLYEANYITARQKVLIEVQPMAGKEINDLEQKSIKTAEQTEGDSNPQISEKNAASTLSLKEKFDLLRDIDCPRYPQVIDYIALEDKEYLVLQPWSGKSLASLVSESNVTEPEALDIAIKLCQCIDEIHSHGYLQLNIEPGNIYLYDGQVGLFDFSRALKKGDTRLNYLTTDGFSAPELMVPEGAIIDARTDIYSIGAVLFWMISGTRLTLAGTYPTKIVTMVSSPELARILLSCISIDINSRYLTARELQERLQWYQSNREKNLHYDSASLSDIGMLRDNNEDACFVMEYFKSAESQVDSYGVYLVADGMGGHAAGEIASTKAVETISSSILKALKSGDKPGSYQDLIKEAIEQANVEILGMAKIKPSPASAGTTVTLGLRVNNDLYLGHVGDSRCYLVRGGKLARLTRDHSVVGNLLQRGKITIEQAKHHPDRGKIYRCLGSAINVTIDTLKDNGHADSLPLCNGDKLIFCTDGLTNDVSDEDILDGMERKTDANSICHGLIQLADAKGGGDNITVVVVRVIEIRNWSEA